MTEREKDPIEGLDFIDFNEDTKTLVIQVHPSLLAHIASENAMGIKAIEIMGIPGVDVVTYVPRKTSQP